VSRCTVYACDAEPIVLEGLRCLIERTPEFDLVGEAATPAESLGEIGSLRPQLLLLDYRAGWQEVNRVAAAVKSISPDTKPVLWGRDLTAGDSYRALHAGVRGIFNRTLSTARLLECLRRVAAGGVWMEGPDEGPWRRATNRSAPPRLTPREREVVQLVAEGLKNREIAQKLAITPGTVKVHLMHVFEKTLVKDRFQLAVQARALLEEPEVKR